MTGERTFIGYNGLGDVSTYHETQMKLGSSVVENIDWNGTYGVLGLVGTSDQTTRRTGREIVDGEVRLLDVTDTTHTREMKYTRNGSNLRTYRKTFSTQASPDVVQLTAMDGATYDLFGQVATFQQRVDRVTAEAVGADGRVDESKAVLHTVTETDRSEAILNDQGGVTGYTETTLSSDGRGRPAGKTVTHRSNMVFHPLGQLRSYDGNEVRDDSPDILSEIHWQGTFDRWMRSSGAVEHKIERLAGGATGIETTTVAQRGGLRRIRSTAAIRGDHRPLRHAGRHHHGDLGKRHF